MKKFDEINIIPFIDIMLVLLAIVLVTSSFIAQGKIKVNLPHSSSEVKLTADELAKLLTINAQGEFFYNDKPISEDALDREMASWDPSQKVTLKVDAQVSFQGFVSITDILAKYKITNVAIVTLKNGSGSSNKDNTGAKTE